MALDRSTTRRHRIDYVDVFGAGPLTGNPVAVVHGAGDLDDDTLAALARWTNLSETTFLLPPTEPRADYRVRIFTPDRELPFAGHPTLGSAHAWLQAGGTPRSTDGVVQQCGIGPVRLRRERERLAFAAPPLIRSGPVDADELAPLLAALDLDPDDVTAQWIDNGPGWIGLLLREPAAVLALAPRSLAGFPSVGVAATYPAGHPYAVEVRAFIGDTGIVREDPVTGSLHAALAQWLVPAGRLPQQYVGAQGSGLGRHGQVHVQRLAADLWIGGTTITTVSGELDI